jgi:eukaryotic-like serine/threonine-protein kinase
MSDVSSLSGEKERQLNEVLARYLETVEAGETPDRAALLAQHPDLAGELVAFFSNLDGLVDSVPTAPNTTADPVSLGPAPLPGSRFGDYEILTEIARGGMGVVYRARHLSLNREVALKMILGGRQANEPALRRFRIEAEAVAHLDHPNIVPIYDVGEIYGHPYFTMKFVEGGSLSRHLDEFQLPRPERGPHPGRAVLTQKATHLAGLLAVVSRAVHHAHQRGILHRDLKPANILLDGEGRPLVADFGLAKRVEVRSNLTQSLTIVGTANYMAPEQAQGSKKPLTMTADVYSLGAILYEFLTGRPPIIGDSYMATLIKVVEETPIPPTERNPCVPADLETICLKALAKEPEQRYGTALELARDLERWCAGDIISLRSPTVGQRAWHWARRNPMAAALLGTIVGLMAVVTIGSTLSAWQIAAARDRADINARNASLARDDAEEQAKQARAARDDAEKALKEKQRVLVSSYVANGTHALDGGDVFGALLWYGEALHLDQGDAAREDPHRVRLASVLRRSPKLVQVWFDHDPALSPAFSPDGRRVVLLHKDSARIWDVAGGEAMSRPFRHAGAIKRAAFSPDGSRVVTTAADGTACIWEAAGGKALTPMLKHDNDLHWAAFSRNGANLVTVGADRFARVWDARTGKLRFELRHQFPVLFASFSADGRQLATCGGDPDHGGPPHGEVRVWDLDTTAPTWRAFKRPGVQHWVQLTADSKSVVAVGGKRLAHLWSLAAPANTGPSVGDVYQDPDSALGRDPTFVLRLDGLAAQVYDLGHGTAIGAPMPHAGVVVLGAFSPDGTRVVTAARDRTARVWDAGTGTPLTPPLRHGGLVLRAAFSDDGHRLLTTAQDGVVRVWDLPSRDPEKPVELSSGAGPMALSPDGRLVASVDAKGAVWVREIVADKVWHGPWPLPGPVTKMRFAPDGRRLVAASDAGARVFDVVSGKAVTPILAHIGHVRDLALTPDSSRVAILGDKDLLEVYDAVSGKLQSKDVLPGKGPPGGLVLTPDGRGVAVLFKIKQTIELHDFAGALRAGPFRHTGLIYSAAISPDGSRIAVATAEGAFLWDSAARPTAAPLQHGAPLRHVAFSGDGSRLVTSAEDHSVRVWDVRTGQPVTPLLTYDQPVVWVGLAADGRRLAVHCKNGHAYLFAWDLTPDPRPADDLVRLTQLLAGQTVDSQSGGFEPIEPARLRDAWPRLRAIYPQQFAPKSD